MTKYGMGPQFRANQLRSHQSWIVVDGEVMFPLAHLEGRLALVEVTVVVTSVTGGEVKRPAVNVGL